MKNKQDELKALSQSQRLDITDVSETCGDESSDWSALLDGYRLFRGKRQGRIGEGVALCVKG